MDWVERVIKVRRWTRHGERAAHKPLLLLYALGHFQRYGDTPITFSEAEENLTRLLDEFGPPRKTSPAYPFSREFTKRWRIDVSDEALNGGIDHVGRRVRVNTPERDGIGQPPYSIFPGLVMHGSILPRPHTTG